MKKTILSFIICLISLGAFSQATGVKQPFIEEFTSASENVSATQNPIINALVQANQGQNGYTTNILKYHLGYFGPDPMFDHNPQDALDRTNYYSVTSSPVGALDGSFQGILSNITQASLDGSAANAAPIEITIIWSWTNTNLDSIDVGVLIYNTNGGVDFPANNLLQIVMVEDEINFSAAPGTNGETDFVMVMKEFVLGSAGLALPATIPGTPTMYSNSFPVPDNYYDLNNLGVLAFVQNPTTKEIFNSQHEPNAGFPVGTVTTDLSIVSAITAPAQCDSSLIPSFTVTNMSTTDVTQFDVAYTLNGGVPISETFNTTLVSGANSTEVFPSVPLSGGNVDLVFNVSNVVTSGGAAVDVSNVNDTSLVSSFITIGTMMTPVNEGFENGTLVSGTGYTRDSPSGVFSSNPNVILSKFSIMDGPANSVGAIGGYAASNRSLRFNFYNSASSVELFYTMHKINLEDSSYLTFDRAHRQYSNESDQLEVLVSTDCGTSWTQLYMKAGSNLATLAPDNGNVGFAPFSASNWVTDTVDLASYNFTDEVIIQFKGTSAYGNNLFIDNINIATAVPPCPENNAAFTSSSTDLQADFFDASTGIITSWSWDFGDGNTSTQQNPTNTYASSGTYTVCLITTDSCAVVDTICDSITIINTIGIEEAWSQNLNIYPVPAKDVLHISGLGFGEDFTVDITNTIGQIVTSRSYSNVDEMTMDISILEKGTYYIVIQSNFRTVTKPIMVVD